MHWHLIVCSTFVLQSQDLDGFRKKVLPKALFLFLESDIFKLILYTNDIFFLKDCQSILPALKGQHFLLRVRLTVSHNFGASIFLLWQSRLWIFLDSIMRTLDEILTSLNRKCGSYLFRGR